MSYTPTVWNEGAAPGISAALLNKIENGIPRGQVGYVEGGDGQNSIGSSFHTIADLTMTLDTDGTRLIRFAYQVFVQRNNINDNTAHITTQLMVSPSGSGLSFPSRNYEIGVNRSIEAPTAHIQFIMPLMSPDSGEFDYTIRLRSLNAEIHSAGSNWIEAQDVGVA